MAINLETLEIQFTVTDNASEEIAKIKKKIAGIKMPDVEIGADTSGAEEKIKGVKKKADGTSGNVAVSANTAEADRSLAAVKKKTESLPDGGISVEATTAAAMKGLGDVAKKVEEIPEAPKIKPEVDTTDATSKLNSFIDLMKTAGLIKFGEKATEFAMKTLDTAYEARSARNRLEILGNTVASDIIKGHAAGLHEAYGFNETGLLDMSTRFASAYYGIGIPLEDAAKYGAELTDLVIDYASVLDKTPGEVGDIINQLFRGQVQVLDNLGVMGATIDYATALGLEMREAGEIPEDIDQHSLRYFGMLKMVKDNAITKGYVGDWERTFGQYGNQKTLLGERIQSINEQLGSLMEEPATAALTKLNGLLSTVEGILTGWNDTTFVKQLEDYFGTGSLSLTQQKEIINGIVSPITAINDKLSGPIDTLNSAVTKHQQAYKGLAEMLDLYYGTGEKVDSGELSGAYDAFKQSAEEALLGGENTILSMFEAFAGPEDQWTAATTAAVSNINAYYQGLTDAINEKHAAFEALMQQTLQDGVISREELAAMKENATETMQILMEGVTVSSDAKSQMYFDGRKANINELIRSGSFSARTLEELYTGALAATDEERQKLSTYYESLRLSTYEAAEYNRQWYEKDPTGFLAVNQGQPPATAQEMLADVEKGYQDMLNQMDANLVDQMARFIFPSLTNAFMDKLDKEKITNDQLLTEIIEPLTEYKELADKIRTLEEAGVSISEEASDFLALYDATMGLIGGEEKNVQLRDLLHGKYLRGEIPFNFARGELGNVALNENGEKIRDKNGDVVSEAELWYRQLIEGLMMPSVELFPHAGQYLGSPDVLTRTPGEEIGAGIGSFADELSSALASIPDNIQLHVNLNVGGYEFGVAAAESEKMVARSTGGYASPSYQHVR